VSRRQVRLTRCQEEEEVKNNGVCLSVDMMQGSDARLMEKYFSHTVRGFEKIPPRM
jgi:hypothetical protein